MESSIDNNSNQNQVNENTTQEKGTAEETNVNTNIGSSSCNAENNNSDAMNLDIRPSSLNKLNDEEIKNNKMLLFSEWSCRLWEDVNEDFNPIIIKLNIKNITDSLFAKDEYVDGESTIKFSKSFYKENDVSKHFISHITNKNSSYTGFLNNHLHRNVFGINKFLNKDLYIGQWKENKKDGFGAYFYSSDQNEFLIGNFLEDDTGKNGFHYKENSENNGFEAFFGSFLNGELINKGTFLSFKNEKEGYIYHGNFKDNKKEDEAGYYYDFGNEILFRGRFENDNISHGYIYELISGFEIKSVINYNQGGRKSSLGRDQIIEQIKNVKGFLSDLEKNDFRKFCKIFANKVLDFKKESEADGLITEDKLDALNSRLGKLERFFISSLTIINV